MSLKFYCLSGLLIGSFIPLYVNTSSYALLHKGLYKPHRDFFILRKVKSKHDIALEEKDFYEYIKSVFTSFGNMVYMFTYGRHKEFIFHKQQRCFDLIENFEIVKETADNLDEIQEKLFQYERDLGKKLTKDTYAMMKQEEDEARERNKTGEDFILENLKEIEEITTDESEKIKLRNSIQNKQDYLNQLPFEFKVQNEMNKIKMAELYHNSVNEWKKMKKDALDLMIRDQRALFDEGVSRKLSDFNAKILYGDKDKEDQGKNKQPTKREVASIFSDHERKKILDETQEDLISRFK